MNLLSSDEQSWWVQAVKKHGGTEEQAYKEQYR